MNLSACFDRAWGSFTRQPTPLVMGTIVLVVTNAALGYLAQRFPPLSLISSVVTALMGGGLMTMAVRGSRGEIVAVEDVFAGFGRPVPFLVVHLASIAGVLLCGIGVFVTAFLFAYGMAYVARGEDIGAALGKSKDLALAKVGETLLLLIVVVAMNLAGALICGIGLLVSVPLSFCLIVEVLGELEGSRGGAPLE
jgi:hypothetical protein